MTCACVLVYVQSFNTALLLAVKHESFDAVEKLVFNGAYIEARSTKVVVVVHIFHQLVHIFAQGMEALWL